MPPTALDRKRIAQAVLTLARYNKDYMSDFIKKQPKPRIPVYRFDRKQLPEKIKRVLLGRYHRGEKRYKLKLEHLIAHLDYLQETGRQHVYLFRLPEQQREDALKWLRDFELVKKRLGVETDGRLIWETKGKPELVWMQHRPETDNPYGRLWLKWVQTRYYWVPKKSREAAEFAENGNEEQTDFAPGGTAEPEEVSETDEAEEQELSEIEKSEAPDELEGDETDDDVGEVERARISVRLEERAVTYLVINLKNGDCELRIQALRSSAREKRQRQLDTYVRLTRQFLGFAPVGPTVLAPAIRRALISREVEILSCEAILPEGGHFTGGKNEFPPVDVRSLEAGLATAFKWKVPEGGLARIRLDGRLDEIFVARPMRPRQHRLVLDHIRRWREEGLVDLSSNVKAKPDTSTVKANRERPVVPANGEAEAERPQTIAQTGATQTSGKPTRTQAGKAIGILGAAITGGIRAEQPTVEPGIDSAIREYTKTHVSEKPADGPHRAPKGTRPTSRPIKVSDLPLEQFLDYIKEVASSERSNYEREIELVHKEEKWNSWLYIAAAILALAILATGAALIFASSQLAMGSITALLGALTGHGTLLIRSYRKTLKEKRELILEQQRDSQDTLVMIQMALLIPDSVQRSHTMTKVATDLLRRVTQSVAKSTTPDIEAEPSAVP